VLETGFTVVFYKPGKHVGCVSLNRSEQILYDYMQGRHEERQYWQNKVQTIVGASLEIPDAVARIDSELWRYYLERSEVAPVFKAAVKAWGSKRTSMKNLAEYLVRLWTEPRPKKSKNPELGDLPLP
jgi:sulfur relay (sulfurtransferase) DsrC/TusE family protein